MSGVIFVGFLLVLLISGIWFVVKDSKAHPELYK